MRNIVLKLEYDGSYFHGWQSQINASAVQDLVVTALSQLEGKPVKITGASRTDAGVHALGQAANFLTESKIPADKYAFALNTLLPKGISCVGSHEVPFDFHARFSAIGKRYSYKILNRRLPSALLEDRVWHVPVKLELEKMRQAALLFVGEKDFKGFMSAGSPVLSTVRTIWDLEVVLMDDDIVRITIQGNGFLYNMVRIITGTLVYVGLGKLSFDEVERVLLSGQRKDAGKTAPPQGLYLEKVFYDVRI